MILGLAVCNKEWTIGNLTYQPEHCIAVAIGVAIKIQFVSRFLRDKSISDQLAEDTLVELLEVWTIGGRQLEKRLKGNQPIIIRPHYLVDVIGVVEDVGIAVIMMISKPGYRQKIGRHGEMSHLRTIGIGRFSILPVCSNIVGKALLKIFHVIIKKINMHGAITRTSLAVGQQYLILYKLPVRE